MRFVVVLKITSIMIIVAVIRKRQQSFYLHEAHPPENLQRGAFHSRPEPCSKPEPLLETLSKLPRDRLHRQSDVAE